MKNSVGHYAAVGGIGVVMAWGLWQIAQAEAVDPGSTGRRTENMRRTADEQQKEAVEGARDFKENTSDVIGEGADVFNIDGAGRRAPQAADE